MNVVSKLWFFAFVACAVVGPIAPALAARAALAPAEGEVIVQFKANAGAVRQHALAARAEAGTVRRVLAQRAAMLGARVGRTLEAGDAVGDRMQVVRANGSSAAALAARLAADPDVAFAVPNSRMRRTAAPNDPLYPALPTGLRPNGPDSGQWYLRAPDSSVTSSIDIETAWLRTLGSPSVVVAVLDTGVRPEHPDLAGRLLPGYDFVTDAVVANDGDGRDADASDPGDWVTAADARTTKFSGCVTEDSSWHGTHTSSLVAANANDGIGMAGTAPGVKVLPLRVLGKCFGSSSDIIAAMRWAAGIRVDGIPDNPNPAKVLNMSLGIACVAEQDCACDAAYQAAVDDVLAKGAVIVVAAGNSDGGPVGKPANCRGVMAVLALRHVGTKAGFSDLGPEISIAAPGGNCVNVTFGSPCLYPILNATNTGTTGPAASSWTGSFNPTYGTSFAVPLVAGTAALMFSVQAGLTSGEVKSRIQASARPFPAMGGEGATPLAQCRAPQTGVVQNQCYCNTTFCGAGMLDAGAAVAALAPVVARITFSPVAPVAGTALTFSAGSSTVGVGAGGAIATYLWTLTDSGGITSGFTSATNAATAALTPAAAGSLTVSLTLMDMAGNRSQVSQTVSVAAAPVVVTPPVPAPAPSGGGGGGGALSAPWLLALAGAVGLLARCRRAASQIRGLSRRA